MFGFAAARKWSGVGFHLYVPIVPTTSGVMTSPFGESHMLLAATGIGVAGPVVKLDQGFWFVAAASARSVLST